MTRDEKIATLALAGWFSYRNSEDVSAIGCFSQGVSIHFVEKHGDTSAFEAPWSKGEIDWVSERVSDWDSVHEMVLDRAIKDFL